MKISRFKSVTEDRLIGIKLPLFIAAIFLFSLVLSGKASAAVNVFYSVGQNATDHSSGGNVSITSGIATFTVAQTATNLGVGDRLTAGGNIYYLSSKTDTTHWNVVTKLGEVPSNLSSTAVTSIAHEYTSLNSAIAGAKDVNHINNADLTAANVVLNLPCYYDSGADATPANLSTAYTTGPSNYIKIYTPTNTTTEANQNQRASGRWDTSKYRLEVSAGSGITGNTNYARVDGLQIKVTAASTHDRYGIFIVGKTSSDTTDIRISNNIIQGVISGSTGYAIGIICYWTGSGSNTFRIWNNIIYGFNNANDMGINITSNTAYVYNNTTYDNYYNINSNSPAVTIAKNNIAQNSVGSGFYGTFSASSSNNISDSSNTVSGTNNKKSTTVTFADTGNSDFHLSTADTAAQSYGANLGNDAYLQFQNDIDGQERSGNWDVGADQLPDSQVQVPQSAPNLDSGLVGHWTFDGSSISSGQALDSSGNNKNCTISGATPTAGKLGQALNFNGTSNYVNCGDLGISQNGPATISGWYKFPQFANAKGSIMNLNTRLYQHNANNHLYVASNVDNNDYFNVSSVLKLNQWQHITMAYNGDTSTAKLYIDGTEYNVVLQGGAENIQALSSFFIGSRDSSTRFFSGAIDDVRVYNRALSATEAGMLYNLGQVKASSGTASRGNTSGLVGLWPFDGPDISGTTAYDRSGTGNNGTITSATAVKGKRGQALNFNGTSSLVNLGQQNSLKNLNAPMTVSAWVKYDAVPAENSSIIGKRFDWQFSLRSYRDIMVRRWGSYEQVASSSTLIVGQWYHVAFTLSSDASNNCLIYINGALDKTGTMTTPLNAGSYDTKISGYVQSDVGYFTGQIDDVRVYNRALSATEIGNLYNTGQVMIRK